MISHGKNIKIFCGNSHPALAMQIASALGLPLGKASVNTFSDGEISVSIGESVRGSDVFLVQSTCEPVNNNLMELLIIPGEGPSDGQQKDHRREDHQDHGHPVEHQLSLHPYALLFGKGVQRPQLPEFVQHSVSSSLLVIAP